MFVVPARCDPFPPPRKNASMKDNLSVSKEIILGLFRCSQKLLADLQKQAGPVVVKKPGKCNASKVRVIKTIGLRKSSILPWIVNKDIKARLLLVFICSIFFLVYSDIITCR